ncbi:MAG: hypothetical protein CSA09_00535 [Candidatus Contendobacter odensis]|uniref:Type II secretion system protein N n=1 Tax=Candidatus Contendibacter odensensis TaxID=1400860 RepID=A0A2G6PGM0_9GAMM|nr:MAG: hypothetical protein CSA09_00535 [Candidatus Contendobacter odensis]
MRSILRYGLLALVAFLLFLLLLAPAQLVTDGLSAYLPKFKVHKATGTAINGVGWGIDWHGVHIDRLSWRWQSLALLSGWLELDLKVQDAKFPLTSKVAIAPSGRLRFKDVTGQLPLTKLAKLVGQRLPVTGILRPDLQNLYLDSAKRPQAAHGEIQVLNLRTRSRQPLTLGDFTIQLRSLEPEGIQGLITDNNAPLILKATLQFMPDGRYHFNGEAAIRDPDNRKLQQLTKWLGTANAQGRWNLKFSGILAR